MSTNRCPILARVNPPSSDTVPPALVHLAIVSLGAIGLIDAGLAQTSVNSLQETLRDGDVELELRYRYEFVDSADFVLNANASLLRTRLTYTSAEFRGFAVGVEVDDLRAVIADDFNSTRNGQIDRPIVADPEGTEINRAYVAFRTQNGTRIGVGRQRVTAPRRRFVASLNWRFNEQTFDSLRVTHTFGDKLAFDYAYVWNVNRLFGPDSGQPPPDLEGALHFLDGRYIFDSGAVLHGYGYFLDFDDAASQSSASTGAQFSATQPLNDTWSLPYSIEVAHQSDYADNPIGYDTSYFNAQVGVSSNRLRVTAGFEHIEGDGTPGGSMKTPLAGLNGINGWADQFVTIPDDGLEDLSLRVAIPIGPTELSVAAHEYTASHGNADYGDELNVALIWPIGERYDLLFRYADYRAASHAVDTTKAWVMLTARF